MSAWHGGKGSSRRKQDDQKAYEDGWDRIFGKKEQKENKDEKVNPKSDGSANT